ncbi:MAG: LysM peptidoglycan-binding domain-containing protein [Candidatus Dormiibacterota bacterium]
MFAPSSRSEVPVGRRGVRQPARGTLRRRWGLLVKVAVLTVLVGAVMTQVVLGTAGSRGPSVVVAPGQTLWGIASNHYPRSDPRAAIAAIESANRLDGPGITPGERLLLPPI